MEFIDYPDRSSLVINLAKRLAGDLRRALRHQERVSFIVPGGTTPGPVFDKLRTANINWDRVELMLSDERWVPITSERSNTRLLEQRLLVDHAAKNFMQKPCTTPKSLFGEPKASECLTPVTARELENPKKRFDKT